MMSFILHSSKKYFKFVNEVFYIMKEKKKSIHTIKPIIFYTIRSLQ